jgi:hypothetical protein
MWESINVIHHIPTSLAFEEAKKVAPNYDVYYLERDFREWLSNIGKPAPDNYEIIIKRFYLKCGKA